MLGRRRLSPYPLICTKRHLSGITQATTYPLGIDAYLSDRTWGVKLKSNATESFSGKFTDHVPDILTTWVKCLLHFLTGSFDLAAMPPKLRRLFELKRTKYHRRTSLRKPF